MNLNGPDRKAKANGFTLLELLVVLVILGLSLTIVPPLFSGALPTLTLKGAVRDMQLALRQARSESIVRNQPADIRLLPDEAYYLVGSSSRKQYFPSSIRLGLDQSQEESGAKEPQIMRFFPDGSSSGGHITLSSGDQGYKLSVDWLTGRITIHEVDNANG